MKYTTQVKHVVDKSKGVTIFRYAVHLKDTQFVVHAPKAQDLDEAELIGGLWVIQKSREHLVDIQELRYPYKPLNSWLEWHTLCYEDGQLEFTYRTTFRQDAKDFERIWCFRNSTSESKAPKVVDPPKSKSKKKLVAKTGKDLLYMTA